jgi:hypothetical protein
VATELKTGFNALMDDAFADTLSFTFKIEWDQHFGLSSLMLFPLLNPVHLDPNPLYLIVLGRLPSCILTGNDLFFWPFYDKLFLNGLA